MKRRFSALAPLICLSTQFATISFLKADELPKDMRELTQTQAPEMSKEMASSELWKYVPEKWPEGWKFEKGEVASGFASECKVTWSLVKSGGSDGLMKVDMGLTIFKTPNEIKDELSETLRGRNKFNELTGEKPVLKRLAGSDEFPQRTEPLNLPEKRGFIAQHDYEGDAWTIAQLYHGLYVINVDAMWTDLDTVRQLVGLINLPSTTTNEQPAPPPAQTAEQPTPARPQPPYLPIGLAFLGLASLVSFIKKWPGVTMAVAGAFIGAFEKFKDWGVLQQSANPTTRIPIAGTHLGYPYRLLGRGAALGSAGLALGTQFLESKDIWQRNGSVSQRLVKESISLSVNIGVAGASLGLMAALAETGVGVFGSFVGAAAIGMAGEGIKNFLYGLADRYIP